MRSVLLLGLFLLLGCREPQSEAQTPSLPDQVVEGFTLHESASGERLYTLDADTAYVFEAEQRIEVVLPRVRFYDEEGAVHATLVADAGTIYGKNDNLVARGRVLVETADSTSLRTDSLSWNNRQRFVRTDAKVAIRTPRGEVFGQGLTADAGLSRVEIHSEIEGTSDYEFDDYPEPDSQADTL